MLYPDLQQPDALTPQKKMDNKVCTLIFTFHSKIIPTIKTVFY